MQRGHRILRALLLWLIAALLLVPVAAAAGERIKLGTLAPRGTLYHRVLLELGEAWRRVEGPGAEFIVYPDGTQGDELATVRRMRIGQLNAAMLSAVGLNEIDPGATALQMIPLAYRDWSELDHVRERLRPELEGRLRERGFVVLFWAEAGWVQFFSRAPARLPGDYRPMPIFAWRGDGRQVRLMEALGYRPVELETGDMLPALQTGLVDVVLAPPVFGLAGQFHTVAPHMLRLNWVPIVGAAVISRRTWEGLSAAGREALAEAGRRAGEKLRADRVRLEEEAIAAMAARGLVVHEPTADERAAWQGFVASIYPEVRGTIVPAALFDRVMGELRVYRAGGSGR